MHFGLVSSLFRHSALKNSVLSPSSFSKFCFTFFRMQYYVIRLSMYQQVLDNLSRNGIAASDQMSVKKRFFREKLCHRCFCSNLIFPRVRNWLGVRGLLIPKSNVSNLCVFPSGLLLPSPLAYLKSSFSL